MEYGNAGFGSVHSILSGFRCPEWEGDYLGFSMMWYQ
jgi:hypothetical protein